MKLSRVADHSLITNVSGVCSFETFGEINQERRCCFKEGGF